MFPFPVIPIVALGVTYLAQVAPSPENWFVALLSQSPTMAVVVWMIWLQREDRKADRARELARDEILERLRAVVADLAASVLLLTVNGKESATAEEAKRLISEFRDRSPR